MTAVPRKRSLSGTILDAYKYYCRRSPTVLAMILIAVVLVAISSAFGVLSGIFKSPILTTTVTAETEAFQFRTPKGRQTAWSMPPGKFSILGAAESTSCEMRGFESVCQIATNSRLVVDSVADISMQVSPVGGWTLSISEIEGTPANIRLYDVSGELLLQNDQLLDFHSSTSAKAIRFPFVADSASLGADLFQSMTIDDTVYDLWQPVLLSGDVTMIADNRPGRETYKVLGERLDPGDVLHIGDITSPPDTDSQIGMWGLVTVNADAPAADPADFDGAGVLQVTLHTSFWEVWVTRFGAPDGHVIKASNWTVQQQWPNGQKAWVFFLTGFLLFGFILRLSDTLSDSFATKDSEVLQTEPNHDSSVAHKTESAVTEPGEAKKSTGGET